jgi:hypothetical protein
MKMRIADEMKMIVETDGYSRLFILRIGYFDPDIFNHWDVVLSLAD